MNRDVIRISEIPSQRWDLVIESLERGGPTVLLDAAVPMGLQRWLGFPLADGLVHVYVWTTQEPDRVSPAMVTADARIALAALSSAKAADPRLAEILESAGVTYEYLCDYGTGAVRVATFDADAVAAML